MVKKIFIAGMIAGTLDGSAAVIHSLIAGRSNPFRIFNYVASGVFGEAALAGGMLMTGYGLVFHFIIATIWAMIFFLLNSKMKLLSKNWFVSGMGYGIIVWIVMNLMVLPLSNIPPVNFQITKAIIAALTLMFCIGLPISFLSHRHFHKE